MNYVLPAHRATHSGLLAAAALATLAYNASAQTALGHHEADQTTLDDHGKDGMAAPGSMNGARFLGGGTRHHHRTSNGGLVHIQHHLEQPGAAARCGQYGHPNVALDS